MDWKKGLIIIWIHQNKRFPLYFLLLNSVQKWTLFYNVQKIPPFFYFKYLNKDPKKIKKNTFIVIIFKFKQQVI